MSKGTEKHERGLSSVDSDARLLFGQLCSTALKHPGSGAKLDTIRRFLETRDAELARRASHFDGLLKACEEALPRLACRSSPDDDRARNIVEAAIRAAKEGK